MVLKTGTVKEPEKGLVTDFLVGPGSDWWSNQGPTGGQTGDIINNLI